MKLLDLERRGCEFSRFTEDGLLADSDVGNHRLATPGYTIHGKDGNDYSLEVGHYNVRRWNASRTKIEVEMENALWIDITYYDADGHCHCNRQLKEKLLKIPVKYTQENIMTMVNEIAADSFDAIRYVYTFSIFVGKNENPTPRSLITRWAKENGIELHFDCCGKQVVPLYSGDYIYSHWNIIPGRYADEFQVYLERF